MQSDPDHAAHKMECIIILLRRIYMHSPVNAALRLIAFQRGECWGVQQVRGVVQGTRGCDSTAWLRSEPQSSNPTSNLEGLHAALSHASTRHYNGMALSHTYGVYVHDIVDACRCMPCIIARKSATLGHPSRQQRPRTGDGCFATVSVGARCAAPDRGGDKWRHERVT